MIAETVENAQKLRLERLDMSDNVPLLVDLQHFIGHGGRHRMPGIGKAVDEGAQLVAFRGNA
jgi:hypothetical protein